MSESAGHEQTLADEDLFFSTTNAKGIITAGNSVFERVSRYPIAELIGSPHNILRHPDMPRAVFQLLWDTIAAGEPVVAYVKNRAADGSFYWVLASVVPITGGYLSVRLPPRTGYLEAARQVYGDLVALEREIEGDDVRQRKASIAASTARLTEMLPTAGYADYGAFMRTVLPAEVAARAQRMSAERRRALADVPADAPRAVNEILEAYASLSAFLARVVEDLQRYADVGRALGEHSAYLRTMGDDVRLYALNAQIGASRLGTHGAALDAVARLLTEQSQATSPLVATVADQASGAVGEIDAMALQLSLSAIQAEMVAVVAHEICSDPLSGRTAANMLALADALQRGSDSTFTSFQLVAEKLDDVVQHVQQVGLGITRLSRLALNGRVELASVPDAGSIGTLFSDVARQVNEARGRLEEFAVVEQSASELKDAARHEAMHAASRLKVGAQALSASEG